MSAAQKVHAPTDAVDTSMARSRLNPRARWLRGSSPWRNGLCPASHGAYVREVRVMTIGRSSAIQKNNLPIMRLPKAERNDFRWRT